MEIRCGGSRHHGRRQVFHCSNMAQSWMSATACCRLPIDFPPISIGLYTGRQISIYLVYFLPLSFSPPFLFSPPPACSFFSFLSSFRLCVQRKRGQTIMKRDTKSSPANPLVGQGRWPATKTPGGIFFGQSSAELSSSYLSWCCQLKTVSPHRHVAILPGSRSRPQDTD